MTTSTHSAEQAQAQLDSIRALVERLDHAQAGHDIEECDLATECALCTPAGVIEDDCTVCHGAGFTWPTSERDGLTYDEYHDDDEAREAIYEDPLSVEVRSGWVTPGSEMTPEYFQILLCTGGPAVRIMGELDQYGEPSRAWIEHQDSGTPWQEYHGDHDTGALLTYAAMFITL
jgi:hypothetical protein